MIRNSTPCTIVEQKKYCLLYVPVTGLFHDGKCFRDEEGEILPAWSRYVWSSLRSARQTARAYNKRPAYKHGRIVVLEVNLTEVRSAKESR
jgi:hypothetical protein